MWKLYVYFMSRFLRTVILAVPAGIALTLALERMGIRMFMLVTMVLYLGLLASFLAPSLFLSSNMGWILGLPIQRRQIVLCNYLINASCFLISLFAACLVAFTACGIRLGIDQTLIYVAKGLSFVPRFDYLDLYHLAILLGFVTSVNLAWVTLGGRNRTYWRPLGWVSKDQKRAGLGLLLLTLALAATSSFAEAPLTIFFALLLAPGCMMMNHLGRSLGLNGSRRMKLYSAVGALALIQAGGLFLLGRHHLNTADPARAINAVVFLGPYGGERADDLAHRLLEQDLDAEQFSRLTAKVLETAPEGRRLDPARQASPRFQETISSKTKLDALFATSQLFDFGGLSFSQLRLLLNRVDALRGGENLKWYLFHFLSPKRTKEEIRALLQSNNELEVTLGLLAARYHPDPGLISQIRGGLAHYRDYQKMTALVSLGIISGRKWSISDLPELQELSRPLPVAAFPSCDDINVGDEKAAEQLNEVVLNRCIRQRAIAASSREKQNLESAGWIAKPFAESELRLISQFMGAPRRGQR